MAAGQSAALSGDEPLLIDRIDDEYALYFTPTGRATGEWAAAIARLAAADEEVARCAAAVAEVDDCVSRHAELSERLAELDTQRESAQQRLTAARAAAAVVAATHRRTEGGAGHVHGRAGDGRRVRGRR